MRVVTRSGNWKAAADAEERAAGLDELSLAVLLGRMKAGVALATIDRQLDRLVA